jgi:hypothetical protein
VLQSERNKALGATPCSKKEDKTIAATPAPVLNAPSSNKNKAKGKIDPISSEPNPAPAGQSIKFEPNAKVIKVQLNKEELIDSVQLSTVESNASNVEDDSVSPTQFQSHDNISTNRSEQNLNLTLINNSSASEIKNLLLRFNHDLNEQKREITENKKEHRREITELKDKVSVLLVRKALQDNTNKDLRKQNSKLENENHTVKIKVKELHDKCHGRELTVKMREKFFQHINRRPQVVGSFLEIRDQQ